MSAAGHGRKETRSEEGGKQQRGSRREQKARKVALRGGTTGVLGSGLFLEGELSSAEFRRTLGDVGLLLGDGVVEVDALGLAKVRARLVVLAQFPEGLGAQLVGLGGVGIDRKSFGRVGLRRQRPRELQEHVAPAAEQIRRGSSNLGVEFERFREVATPRRRVGLVLQRGVPFGRVGRRGLFFGADVAFVVAHFLDGLRHNGHRDRQLEKHLIRRHDVLQFLQIAELLAERMPHRLMLGMRAHH
mmetsp:Transcript_23655/g.72775  ORF Transcript_23655/g.72775 Transcript_23655/m.72775 type:complete len:244 (+) Transcript_23655:1479-2210(+)